MRNKKLYQAIPVLSSIYRVYLVRNLSDNKYDGLCFPMVKEIFIDSSLKGENFKRTLLHELAHAYQFECGLCEILDSQALEMMAETFSGFVCALLKIKLK